MKTINIYTKFTMLSCLMLVGAVIGLPFALMSEQQKPLSSDMLFAADGRDIIIGSNGCDCGGGGNEGCNGADGGGGGNNEYHVITEPPIITPYTNPETICAPESMLTRWVDQLDQPGKTVNEFWTGDYYLAVPNDIVTDPRSGRETLSWAAYRGDVLVAEGVVEGNAWIAAHNGYGRGEATIDVPGGFDSLMIFSDEVGSDGNLEFVRGVAMVPEFDKGRRRITK